MKKLILSVLCLSMAWSLAAKSDYYYYSDERVSLDISTSMLAVYFDKEIYDTASRLPIPYPVEVVEHRIANSPYEIWKVQAENMDKIKQYLYARPEVSSMGPVFHVEGGYRASLSSFYVHTLDIQRLREFAHKYKFQILHQNAYLEGWYLCESNKEGGLSSIEICNILIEHGVIDKLWQEWTESGNSTNYIKGDMPRYDGSHLRFDNVILPSVNPNSISNSDDLGVFFAEKQNVIMKNYTVNNTYRPNDVFYYQYEVNTQDAFNVANGATAEIRSSSSVILRPGTTLSSGSDTRVTISGCEFDVYGKRSGGNSESANFYNPNSEKVYESYLTRNNTFSQSKTEPSINFSNYSATVNSYSFRAGNEILLKPVFTAGVGSDFNAHHSLSV